MSRLDQLPGELLTHRVNKLRQALDELKSAQRVGARNVVTCPNESSATHDVVRTLSAGSTYTFSLTFVAAHQDYAKAALSYRMYTDGVGEVHPFIFAGGTAAYPFIEIDPQVSVEFAPRSTFWTIRMSNYGSVTRTFRVKFHIEATDIGEIVVV